MAALVTKGSIVVGQAEVTRSSSSVTEAGKSRFTRFFMVVSVNGLQFMVVDAGRWTDENISSKHAARDAVDRLISDTRIDI